MRNLIVHDAPQRAFNFLLAQSAIIEREVYRIRYREIQYPELIPVDTSGDEWAQSIIYFSMDGVGRAEWFNGRAMDIPNAELLREKHQEIVHMAAIGYRYDIEELNRAQRAGINLSTDKANIARRAAEEFIDQIAFFGDTSKVAMYGITNNPNVTAGAAAATGTGSTTTWSTKTPDNILADVNTALTGIVTGTYGIEKANTLLLPYARLLSISTIRIDATNQTTILEWIERNNIYTKMTGQPLTIRGVWGLETAGSGGTARMIAYFRDPSVVKLHMPMPFRFWPAWQVGPIIWEVPGLFRLGGVEIRRPKAFRYVDGI